jgi:transposase
LKLPQWHLQDAMKTKPSFQQPADSIYRNQNALLRSLFERASDPRKVLCVALDYAKRKHVALCCDGNGDILRKPFSVDNTVEGVAFLVEQIKVAARRRKIPKSAIFLGGEDEPSYVANFTAALRGRQYLVLRVNAAEAAKNRENLIASTDLLALLGIAKTLLSRRARATGTAISEGSKDERAAAGDIYFDLRELSRCRRNLVRQQTAASNRIHALVDQLFPGFLEHSKSGLTPFCAASLALMKERFSAPEIARRRPRTLASSLARHGVREPDEVAAKLIALGRGALPPAPCRLGSLQHTLTATVDLRECLSRNANALRQQAATLLASTPYAMLTSIPGIGFTLAAGMAGELGNPLRLSPLDSLCAFAGIVPRTFQSGGPDQPASQGHTPARCNHILKDWTVQSAQKIHLYGPPELKERISRWNANGQHGAFAAARRYLRLLRSLVLNQVPYLDPKGRSSTASDQDRADAALQAWLVLLRKWQTIPNESLSSPRKPPPWAFGATSSCNPVASTCLCAHEAFTNTFSFPTQTAGLPSTVLAEMKTGGGATGWLILGCRALRDGSGQYAKTPVAPDPTAPSTARVGPWLKDTLPRSRVKAGLMARHTSLPG